MCKQPARILTDTNTSIDFLSESFAQREPRWLALTVPLHAYPLSKELRYKVRARATVNEDARRLLAVTPAAARPFPLPAEQCYQVGTR